MNTENHPQPSSDQVKKDIEIVRQLLVDNEHPDMSGFFELVEVGEIEAALVGGVRVLSEMGVEVPNHVRLHAEELDRIEKQRIAEQTRLIHEQYKNGLMLKMCVWVGRVRGVFLPILVGV